MKKRFFFALCLIATLTVQAQISKTVNCTAGALTSLLSTTEKATVTNLTITGVIDGRDFVIIRDSMPLMVSIDMESVTIANYAANPVNAIPTNCFKNKILLNQIILPSSIKTIGSSAFYGCSGLITVNIPSSVTSIGDGAFYDCSGLTSFTIPSLVTTIGKFAFFDCSGLTTVTIPSSVTSLGNSAFSGCSGLSSIDIPSSITSIGYFVFNGCSGLTSFTIPASVTFIGGNAFDGCSGLSSIFIPASVNYIEALAFIRSSGLITVDARNPNYSSIDGVIFNKAQTQLLQCPTSIKHYTIPSSVTGIGYPAFEGCSSLDSVFIPSSVKYIDSYAFRSCSGLITVDAENLNFSSIEGVLFNKSQTQLIQYPTSKIGNYTIPSSVNNIMPFSFFNCTGLSSVIIPSSVTGIGNDAFSGCTGLTSVAIPSSVAYIDRNAFNGCIGISSVVLPSSIKAINDYTFYGCSGLSSVVIPSSITSIGQSVFENCSNLNTVIIPSSVTSIGYSSFSGCVGLTSLTVFINTPIKLLSFNFSQVDKSTCILYVPIGSKALYQAASVWKDFQNIVEISNTGVEAIESENIRIYPNPVSESFQIVGLSDFTAISIVNANGQIVLQQNINANQTIGIASLPKGTYFLRINTKKGVITQKLLKN